jgi:hypothetical protein
MWGIQQHSQSPLGLHASELKSFATLAPVFGSDRWADAVRNAREPTALRSWHQTPENAGKKENEVKEKRRKKKFENKVNVWGKLIRKAEFLYKETESEDGS